MDYRQYRDRVAASFQECARQGRIGDVEVFYEEVFRWRWIATKLKISSFVSFLPRVDGGLMKEYTDYWYDYAGKHRRGMPRGWQNGDVVYAVAVTDRADESALACVSRRPSKHFSAFEFPLLMELSTRRLHYYRGDILWGMMYTNFMRGYADEHFGCQGK